MKNYALSNKSVNECTTADLLLWRRLYESEFFNAGPIIKGDYIMVMPLFLSQNIEI